MFFKQIYYKDGLHKVEFTFYLRAKLSYWRKSLVEIMNEMFYFMDVPNHKLEMGGIFEYL